MVVLVTGANGFIGRHLVPALMRAGHTVIAGTRQSHALGTENGRVAHMPVDFMDDIAVEHWQTRLKDIDVVVNAVGIISETSAQSFERVHIRGPAALFAACAALRIRVIQISALGADRDASSRYHLTKRRADDELLAINGRAVVIHPSLVFGPDGASAQLITMLASLPVIPLPAGGQQRIQPIYIDDLIDALLTLVASDGYSGQRLPLVGPEPVSLKQYLRELRRALSLGKPIFISVPKRIVDIAAQLRVGLLDHDTWQMLQRGNVGGTGVTRELLGREPRAVSRFIDSSMRNKMRVNAQLSWLLPLLRLSIAVVWLTAGVVSMGLYPVTDSYALLARVGVPSPIAPLALYGAAALDIALGIGTLILRRRRLLWLLQLTVIIAYTAIITVWLPEFWLHPYGPVVKNLPVMIAIYLLFQLERR